MKIVLDTNVFVSAVFFGGVPGRILTAWRDGSIELVVSSKILHEYHETGKRLATEFPGVDLHPLSLWSRGRDSWSNLSRYPKSVCDDPDDDMFIACAIASGADFIVRGDRVLLRTSGYGGISVLSPRAFAEGYL